MPGVSVLTILIFILHSQASFGQQNGVASNCQQAVQNNVAFSQTADPANLNIQMQQSAKQASSSQQSYNLQQLANIPMQTFNVQQPVNFQQQANAPLLNFQPVSQAMGLQQIPHSINLQEAQHDVQQPLSSPINLQNPPAQQASPQPAFNVKAAAPPVIVQQQTHPIQAANFQQQAYPVNLQQPVQMANLQPQTPQQCVNLQNSVVVQPSNLQQQAVVNSANIQQTPQYQANILQPSQPYLNVQQQSAHVQPAVIVQPVTSYQQPVTMHEPIVQQLNVQKCSLQDPFNVQQVQIQQTDSQQKQAPCQSIGGYQVVTYQKPCQQPDVAALPMSLQLSKVSTNPYPTVIAAVPAGIPESNKIVQRTEHMYLVNPQNYVNSASYSAQTPTLVMDNMQQVASGPITMPATSLPVSNPTSAVNLVISNPNQCAEALDNSSSVKSSDLGILSILQGQFPVASLLNQPSSSFESALLSSILSSIQTPASSHQYLMANYPSQTVLAPPCSYQNSKFSLKSLLPLLLNLLTEKYSGCGCQCQCCNCERKQNDNDVHESPKTDDNEEVQEVKTTEVAPIEDDVSLEEEDIPINPRHREKSKYQNMISDDSEEIEETEDSGCGIEAEDIGTGSGDEDDSLNDNGKL